MRLIDADELKKLFPDNGEGSWTYNITAKMYIDNAPTVIPDNDIFEWCTDCKEHDQEKHCCHRWSSKIREAVEEVKQCKLDELRPKGEWTEEDGRPQCPFCKTVAPFNDYDGFQLSKFCPECGADMQKGGKEE